MAAQLDRVGLISWVRHHNRGALLTPPESVKSFRSAPTDYTAILTAIRMLLDQGLELSTATANIIFSPSWLVYQKLKTGLASDLSQLPLPRALENTTCATAQGLDSDSSPQTSSAVLGNFADLVLGVRREASINL
jgi:hypothetical protein